MMKNRDTLSIQLPTTKTAPEPKVLVMIHAYNEQENIARVIKSIRNHVPEGDVVVVDDGSTDNSGEIARSYPGVRVIRQENQGGCKECHNG